MRGRDGFCFALPMPPFLSSIYLVPLFLLLFHCLAPLFPALYLAFWLSFLISFYPPFYSGPLAPLFPLLDSLYLILYVGFSHILFQLWDSSYLPLPPSVSLVAARSFIIMSAHPPNRVRLTRPRSLLSQHVCPSNPPCLSSLLGDGSLSPGGGGFFRPLPFAPNLPFAFFFFSE